MGIIGTLFVGAVIGLMSLVVPGPWRGAAAPLRDARSWPARAGFGVLVCAVGALLVKMLGNVLGVLVDGSVLEWCASVCGAIIVASAYRHVALRAKGPGTVASVRHE